MPVIDTSVLLCGLAFPDSYSGEFLKKVKGKQAVGVVSNTIKDEAVEISRLKAPDIEKKINEFVTNHTKYISISEKDITGLRYTTNDRKDDHVIATAIATKENMIYTLDLGFFSEKMKNVSKEYGIRSQFPSFECYLKNPLEDIFDLPNYKPLLTSSRGSITLFLTTTWDSLERRHIKKRWYVMDVKDIFGLWYETHKQAFKFLPYPLGNEYIRHIPITFTDHQHIRFTVTFNAWCFLQVLFTESCKSFFHSIASPFSIMKAAKMARDGKNPKEIVEEIVPYAEHMEHIFTVDSLEHLKRGGRISAAQAFVGGLLSIKPILHFVDGAIQPLEKVRGRKNVINRMVEIWSKGAKILKTS